MKRILLSTSGGVKEGYSAISHAYIKAVEKVGLPMVAPICNPLLAAVFAENTDALILTGGGDMDSSRFGQQPHPEAKFVEPLQDESDLALFRAFRGAGKPILGICRGMQVINVAMGGDLLQHIPDRPNSNAHSRNGEDVIHQIVPQGESFLGIRQMVEVASAHHQAVGRLGEGLEAVAHAEDGIVEAIQSGDRKVMAVQWHPERLESQLTRHIFEYFASSIM